MTAILIKQVFKLRHTIFKKPFPSILIVISYMINTSNLVSYLVFIIRVSKTMMQIRQASTKSSSNLANLKQKYHISAKLAERFVIKHMPITRI